MFRNSRETQHKLNIYRFYNHTLSTFNEYFWYPKAQMFVCKIQVRLMLGDYLKFTTRGRLMGVGNAPLNASQNMGFKYSKFSFRNKINDRRY